MDHPRSRKNQLARLQGQAEAPTIAHALAPDGKNAQRARALRRVSSGLARDALLTQLKRDERSPSKALLVAALGAGAGAPLAFALGAPLGASALAGLLIAGAAALARLALRQRSAIRKSQEPLSLARQFDELHARFERVAPEAAPLMLTLRQALPALLARQEALSLDERHVLRASVQRYLVESLDAFEAIPVAFRRAQPPIDEQGASRPAPLQSLLSQVESIQGKFALMEQTLAEQGMRTLEIQRKFILDR